MLQAVEKGFVAFLSTLPFHMPLVDDEDLDKAIGLVSEVMSEIDDDPYDSRHVLLTMLSLAIKEYEDKHSPLAQHLSNIKGSVAALRVIMDQYKITQSDLAPVFGKQSHVSEVLSGKRKLGLRHAERLSELYKVPKSVFID